MPYLVADSLSRKYGHNLALDDFSLSVNKGELFALLGPDGAGKTTMIRVLCRLLDPDSGSVTINGLDLQQRYDDIKPILGYMPQQFSLYPDLSVEENMTFYAGMYGVTGQAYRDKRDQLYQFSKLGPFAKRRASALSGGMKQKLALSCALIHNPRMLILDEPTTGVDPLSRRQFWETLLQLKSQGVTILVSTPYMDEVARCDRAAFIFGGRKLAEDRPAQLAAAFQGSIFYIDREPTSQLLNQIMSIDGLTTARFGAGMHLYLAPDDSLDPYLNALSQLGLNSSDINPIAPSLEDRFIQLMESPT
ncbi:MAG: ABC transporter ATP-binding protein [candidate division Zixibacteria bacterium]|nr:ABC transporter ATP-binding protein [candidate division Zixibacteria bacterium]